MNLNASPVHTEPPQRWQRLLWIWALFWLLLVLLGVQEYRWSGGRQIWRPLVDYGCSAVAGTVLAAVQMRRSRRIDPLLGQPFKWFTYQWAWMPLQLLAFLLAMYVTRFLVYRFMDAAFQPAHLSVAYDAAKFTLFYTMLGGIQFGLRSYRAWTNERLRSELQARLAQQAQLAQLTQQLQPHFLFNALNTVSSLIHTDPDMADELLTRLSTLLRAATDASQRPQQPLADELSLLHAYADIMTQRFADRVAIRWEVDALAERCMVPTMGLQALLENCFRHVVEQRRACTHIVIRAALDAGRLCIDIEDDGDLQTVPSRHGVGLGNLQRRLDSLHGTQAELRLTTRAGGGLIVHLELPCVY